MLFIGCTLLSASMVNLAVVPFIFGMFFVAAGTFYFALGLITTLKVCGVFDENLS